jgi:hypothetical protein
LERARKGKLRARRRWVEMEDGGRKEKAKEEWKELRREMKRLVRKKRVSDTLERMQRIERLGRKEPRKMWQAWKKWGEKEKNKERREEMLGAEGEVVRGEEIAGAWATVFKKVVVEMEGEYDEELKEEVVRELRDMEEEKEDGDGRSARYKDGSQLNVEMTGEEVEEVVQNMKNGKASGVDEVIAEVLKHGGEGMMMALVVLCRDVWGKERIPKDWMKGVIFPILKKGDKKDMGNYRGISLLSVVGKVFAAVLNHRVIKWAEGVLVEEQFGFRPGRGCRDPLFVLREIVRNRAGRTVYAAFMDIKKAYPTVWRDGLWCKVSTMGVRGKMGRVLKKMNEKRECGVV